jgi:hypothetical protein
MSARRQIPGNPTIVLPRVGVLCLCVSTAAPSGLSLDRGTGLAPSGHDPAHDPEQRDSAHIVGEQN